MKILVETFIIKLFVRISVLKKYSYLICVILFIQNMMNGIHLRELFLTIKITRLY